MENIVSTTAGCIFHELYEGELSSLILSHTTYEKTSLTSGLIN